MTNQEGAVDEGGVMLILSQQQAVVPPLDGDRGEAAHLAVEHEGLLLHGDEVAGLQREGELGLADHTWRHVPKESQCTSSQLYSDLSVFRLEISVSNPAPSSS